MIEIRHLGRDELVRVAEIDRTEHIDALYRQVGEVLVEHHGDWDSPGWAREDLGSHSVPAKLRELHGYVDQGGVALGALVDSCLVGIGVVVPDNRPGEAQLAFLHVSAPWRGRGVGSRLSENLDELARGAGALRMVVSATPSKNTVEFYMGRGFLPTAHPSDRLRDLEPDDIQMCKVL